MCTQAIDTAHSFETGKGLRIQNQPKGIQSHQPYIDSRQIGVYTFIWDMTKAFYLGPTIIYQSVTMDVSYLWLCMHVALQIALLCGYAFKLANPSKSCVNIGVYSNQSILFGT